MTELIDTQRDERPEYRNFYRLVDEAYERMLRRQVGIIAWAQLKKDREP